MQIPSEFNVFGHRIVVIHNPDLHNETGDMGIADDLQDLIMLQPNTEEFAASDEQLEYTFLHEQTHQLLWKIGRDDLSADEEFVSLYSKALHQAMTTYKYNHAA